MVNQIYPKRLIEVDLPIKAISAHARNEKVSHKDGHISSLHIWWARRPLIACRAVVLSAILLAPTDSRCPISFIRGAIAILKDFKNKRGGTKHNLEDPKELQVALLEFVAEFSIWGNSNHTDFTKASKRLVECAHEALGNPPGSKPLILDPFAGGGTIPFEAMRVGANVFAGDINPVAILINKVLLEYLPKHGYKLGEYVRQWGAWLKLKAQKQLSEFYPIDAKGSIPITYLWARTIVCEGPGCGAEIPLLKSLWLAQKGDNSVALKLSTSKEKKAIELSIIEKAKANDVHSGTVRRGTVTCPKCGYTTPVTSVRTQLKGRNGGLLRCPPLCCCHSQFS